MSEEVCKAAICDDKAQDSAAILAGTVDVLKDEKPELRIKVAEFIIERNEKTLSKVIEMIGNA